MADLSKKAVAVLPREAQCPNIGYTQTANNLGEDLGVLLDQLAAHQGVLGPIYQFVER
jgi:hypothetical protein